MIEISPFRYQLKLVGQETRLVLHSDEAIYFEEKKLHLITGPSGSGKSTLLKCLSGSYKMDPHVSIQGEVTTSAGANEIGHLFQNPFNQIIHLNPDLELAFYAENKQIKFDDYAKNLKDILSEFKLDNLTSKKTSQLSNGEAQKLLLASLLLSKPKVLFLDEPTAFLDPEARRVFYTLIGQLKQHVMIVLVDHHLEESLPIADTITAVNIEGKVTRITSADLDRSAQEPAEKLSLSMSPVPDYEILVRNLTQQMGQDILLQEVNFTAQSKDVIVLKGRNGSGKSTFFKILSQFMKPSGGKITHTLNGQKLSNQQVIDHIGFVLQNSDDNFFHDRLIEEFNPNRPIPFVDLLLKDVNLNQSPFLLSEGQKRRAAILIQLNLNKKVIFYDEPTYGQDRQNQINLVQIIHALKEKNLLQIIISHDDDFIRQIATHVYQIQNKKIVLLTGGPS